jgi:hypothetical protein
MFVVNEQQKGLKAENALVLSVLHSINEPKIAAADHPAEPTQAFVVTVGSENAGTLQTHIVLFQVQSNQRVLYSWRDGAYPSKERTRIEEEALDFVEHMGFMMDNLNLESMQKAQRESALTELPIFEGPLKAAPIVAGETVGEKDIVDLDSLGEILEPAGMEREEPEDTQDLADLLAVDDPAPSFTESIKMPVAAASPAPKAASSPEFEDEAMKLMEAEFSRPSDDVDAGFAEAMDALNTNVQPKPTARVAQANPRKESGDALRALVRLMAGF